MIFKFFFPLKFGLVFADHIIFTYIMCRLDITDHECYAALTIYLVHMHRLWVPGIAHIKTIDYNQQYGIFLYVHFVDEEYIIPY